MIYVQSMLALDMARERGAEAAGRSRRHRQLVDATSNKQMRRATLISTLAWIVARASRGSAGLAQRLDRRTADEVLSPEVACTPA